MPERPLLQLHLSPAAEDDLIEIWAYISDDSAKAATAFVKRIEAKFEPLLSFPAIGTARDQLSPGLRVVPYKDYCIYYTYDDATVTIVRVVHGARDVRTMF